MRWLGIVGACLLVLGALGLALLHMYIEAENRSVEAKGRSLLDTPLRRHLDAFREDLDALADSDFFSSARDPDSRRTRGRDAAPFLSPKVTWSSGREALVAKWNERARAEGIVLPDALVKQLEGWHGAWLLHVGEIDLRTLNFEWMSELERFDYWDLDAVSPIAAQLARDPTAIELAEYPDVSWQILHWARLGLIKGMQEPDPGAAFRQVRALARLLYSTESGIAVVAIRILHEEGQAYAWLQSEGRAPEGWTPISPEILKRARRVIGLASAFTSVFTPEHAARTYFGHESGVGLCAALREALPTALLVRGLLLPAFAKEYQRLDRALEQSKRSCRLRDLRRWWNDGTHVPKDLRRASVFLKLPGLRTSVGLTLARRVMWPHGFEPYEELRPGAGARGSEAPEPRYAGRALAEWEARLTDRSTHVRQEAVQALDHFGPRVVPRLVEVLGDPAAAVREAAALGLAGLGPAAKAAGPALAQALGDTHGRVRLAAAVALGRIGWEELAARDPKLDRTVRAVLGSIEER